MGQKVNPCSLRLGINRGWKSCWYVDSRGYAKTLHEDLMLRKTLMEFPEARGADIADVEIIRQPGKVVLTVYTARPGVLIGSKGVNIEKINTFLQKKTTQTLRVKIKEIRRPELEAQVIGLNIARQLKMRSPFRKVLKQAISLAMKAGVLGIKIRISGRLGGSEMAREFELKEGRIPLHTLRADIDYGFTKAVTTYGVIGIKVWVFKSEILGNVQKEDAGVLVSKLDSGRGANYVES